MTESQKPAWPEHTRVGQPFNPFRLFTGIFIPEALVRSELVSPGAKMAYGRLARYAGQDGRCWAGPAALLGVPSDEGQALSQAGAAGGEN